LRFEQEIRKANDLKLREEEYLRKRYETEDRVALFKKKNEELLRILDGLEKENKRVNLEKKKIA